VDLASSIGFVTHRSGSDLICCDVEDVLPVSKVAADSLWHGIDVYVGVQLRCRKCGTEFRFSAVEQKAWRKDFGFSIHSYPIHCRACRVVERDIARLRKQLDAVLSLTTYSQQDIDELIAVAGLLVSKGRRDLIGPRLRQKIFWAAKRSLHPSAS